jgi:hypothetical protein
MSSSAQASVELQTHLLLSDLQRLLQRRYDVTIPYQVEDFVSHDADLLTSLSRGIDLSRESLLIREEGDNLDVTLFLDEAMLAQVASGSWSRDWHGEDFNTYCTILEGVSHFLYLIWSASHRRSVRPVDLELQAEVDKFVFAALEPGRRSHGSLRHLMKRLFVDISMNDNLSQEVQSRYARANASAHAYCAWLCRNFDLAPDNRRLHAELARFYRSGGQRKFNRIRRSCPVGSGV